MTVETPVRPAAARPRIWVGFLVAAAVGTAAYVLTPIGLGQDAIYQVFGVSSAAAIVVGVRLYRPVRPRAWYLMALGQLCWSVADGMFSWDAHVAHNDRFPTPADPVYLVGYPIVGAGLLLMIRGRRPRRDVAGFLDSAIVTVGLGILSWVLLARPALLGQQSTLGAVVAVAYPVGDILLIGLLVRLLITPGGRTRSLRLLLLAVTLLIVVDTAASTLDLLTYDSSDAINPIWLASYAVWGAAALEPSMRSLSEPTPDESLQFSRTRLVALTLALLVAPATLAGQQLSGATLDVGAVVIGGVLMLLLVVARMKMATDQLRSADRRRERVRVALVHQAAHDGLTGLANRAQAEVLLRAALARAQRSGHPVGVLFVDLDGFKLVNDRLGHAAGDEVLQVVARRMQSTVREGDVAARIGGDEFVVLLEDLTDEGDAVETAERLVRTVSAPISLRDGRPASVGASVGVALSRDGGTDADTLLRDADAAVYRAKAAGRGRVEVFDRSLQVDLQRRAALDVALARAIERDELVVHYQPIHDLVTGFVEGFEALVRWRQPGGELVPPSEFVPAAERSEVICELDAWMLRRATSQMARWNLRSGRTDLTIAVNVSARHAARSRIVADVTEALAGSGLLPRQLILEITETTLMDDLEVLTHLQRLRELGVTISLDDFGTGYSSVARLELLPVDVVKIDRHFLDEGNDSARRLLPLMIQVAHAFDRPVVAEGVERPSQVTLLRALGCESAQGYHFGAPVEAAEAEARWIAPVLAVG